MTTTININNINRTKVRVGLPRNDEAAPVNDDWVVILILSENGPYSSSAVSITFPIALTVIL